VVRYPIELCRHRVDLVDSPGLGVHQTRTQRTQSFLNRADAIVMVLDATQLLKLEEVHFLDTVLLPRGLKNIFFVINKWNLVEEAMVRPEDLEANCRELEARIYDKLTPFCVIGGIDRSAERIFRINALGALRARLRKPPAVAMLEESNVPTFEAALQRFLVEDRGKARADVGLAAMKTAS
jgi:tRNA U34 5-carboxymethylaminomethyl modifying GTPase MnmE/TrmE